MRSDYVKSDILRLLYNSMQYENGLALRVCVETGLRIGDVLALPANALKGQKLTYTASKTKKTGVKTISADLAARLRGISGREHLFEGRRGGTRTRQAVYMDLKKACKALGITGQISPHSARKTYAVEKFREHGLEYVRKELQHNDQTTTMLYALSDVLEPSKAPKQENKCFGCVLSDINERSKLAEEIAQKVAELLKGN